MLQFLKKSGRKDHKTTLSIDDKKNNVVNNQEIDQQILDSENFCEFIDYSSASTRLSRNLKDILLDKSCICYFVQFLETKHALSLVKFWLDVESFRTASELCKNNAIKETRNKLPYTTVLSRSNSCDFYEDLLFNLPENLKNKKNKCEDDSTTTFHEPTQTILKNNYLNGENSNDPKFLTEFSNRRSLTDDEKFQIRDKKNESTKTKTNFDKNFEHVQNEFLDKGNSLTNNRFQSSITTDAIRIYKKYLISNAVNFIEFSTTILSNISLAICDKENNDSSISISPCLFDDAQKYIFNRLEEEYLNSFLESIFYCKFTVDILTSDSLTLNDILYSDSVLFYLMEFLEQENKRSYLDFWISATNFQNQLNNYRDHYKHTQTQSDAMVLYEKYFSLQATNSLNMSDKVRYRIEESICKENGPIFNCFELPIRIIEYYLDKNYLQPFLKSQLFYKYLAELFNKIQKHKILNEDDAFTNSTKKTKHRKTLSDCSSDQTKQIRSNFVSTHNTLLAMESKSKNKMRSASTSDMVIDSCQLYNPDLLWRRNSVAGLSFGRIDSLGRYEREYEIDSGEDKWTLSFGGNKLKKAVKKLVNLPEENVQEEIAWKIAEMIVRDITNITMNDKT